LLEDRLRTYDRPVSLADEHHNEGKEGCDAWDATQDANGDLLGFAHWCSPAMSPKATGRIEFTYDAVLPWLHQAGRLDCTTQTGRCF
jgi:hypothetical protein